MLAVVVVIWMLFCLLVGGCEFALFIYFSLVVLLFGIRLLLSLLCLFIGCYVLYCLVVDYCYFVVFDCFRVCLYGWYSSVCLVVYCGLFAPLVNCVFVYIVAFITGFVLLVW